MRTLLLPDTRRALAVLALLVAAVASVASNSGDEHDDGDGSPTPDNGPWTLVESATGTSLLLNGTNLSATFGLQTGLTAPAFAGGAWVTGEVSLEVNACVTGSSTPARVRVLLVPTQPTSGSAREGTVAVCPSSTTFSLADNSFYGCAEGVDCVRGFDAIFERVDSSPSGDLSIGWSASSEASGDGVTPPDGTVLTLTVEP